MCVCVAAPCGVCAFTGPEVILLDELSWNFTDIEVKYTHHLHLLNDNLSVYRYKKLEDEKTITSWSF